MRKYYDDFNEEYERGYEDGRNSVFENYLDESEDNKDAWKILKNSNYGKYLNIRNNDFFFESPEGELSVELELNTETDRWGDEVTYIDTFSLVGGQFNIDKISLEDTLDYLKKMRGLSEENKQCKKDFIKFLRDIKAGRFEGINLAYSTINI